MFFLSSQLQFFCFSSYLHSQRLSGISWQRTPSPGLTVKGGNNLLNTLHLEKVCARVGEGFPSGFLCNEKLLPSTGPGLKSSLGSEAQNVDLTRKSTFTVEPTIAFTFQSLRSWKPIHYIHHWLSHICQDDFNLFQWLYIRTRLTSPQINLWKL